MPGGSGLDILAKLDAKRYVAPIIVVSGRSDVPDVVEAIKRGAFDYIEKQRVRETLVAARARSDRRGGGSDRPASAYGIRLCRRFPAPRC